MAKGARKFSSNVIRGFEAVRKSLFLATFLLLLLASIQAWGQVDTGSIVGVVRDASGAPIADGQVTLTSQETGQITTARTNTSGEYTFSPVKIGTYTVTMQQPGFEKVIHSNVVVTVQSHVLVDISLSPGQLNETVTVTSGAPPLQTQEASVGQVVPEKVINDLPLNGRNFTFLAQISAGVNQAQHDTRGSGRLG